MPFPDPRIHPPIFPWRAPTTSQSTAQLDGALSQVSADKREVVAAFKAAGLEPPKELGPSLGRPGVIVGVDGPKAAVKLQFAAAGASGWYPIVALHAAYAEPPPREPQAEGAAVRWPGCSLSLLWLLLPLPLLLLLSPSVAVRACFPLWLFALSRLGEA
eukprot:SAG11_NODE_3821_length_2207_cov_2.433586_1_plen_158_part_10